MALNMTKWNPYSVYRNRYCFTPKWWSSILFVLMLCLFILLGFWQIDRAEQKEQLIQQNQRIAHSAPVLLSDILGSHQPERYQPVRVQGYFDNQRSFLLDNKIYQGKVGYQVLTPLKLAQSGQIVLVNRGWVPAEVDRRILPLLSPVLGLQRFTGTVYIPLARQLVLRPDEQQQRVWPTRVQAVDFALFASLLQQPVVPFVVRMDPNAEAGFVRDWSLDYLKPEKHIAYAVQWFGFALVLCIIYFRFSSKRKIAN